MSARTFSFTVDHMVGRREIELVVTYTVTPGSAETGPSYDCGGTPATADEVEIISVTHEGQPFTLSEAEEDALLEQATERYPDDWGEEEADHADYRYQETRDRQMMERWEREAP